MHHPFALEALRLPRPLHSVLAVVALALLAGCGSDGGGEPRQSIGWSAQLVSPNGAEGAAVLELDGVVAATRAPAGTRVMHHVSGGVTRVVVVREEPGQIAFELDLAERGAAPAASVIEVSGPDDALRAPATGYRVSLRGTD